MTQTSRTSGLLVSAAAAVVVVAGIKATSHIVGPVMLALALTIVLHPLRARLDRRVPGWLATGIVMAAAVLLLLSMALAIVVSLGRLAQLAPTYASEIDDLLAGLTSALRAVGVGAEQAESWASVADPQRVVRLATGALAGGLSLLTSLAFIVTLLVFMAFDAATVSRLADGARAHRDTLVDGLGSFAEGTRRYLGVSAVFGLIVAVIDTALLWALGVPGAFIWGVLAFVTNFIPNIGFVIGIIPPALVALLEGGPDLMLAVVVLYSVVNVVIQSFIQPRYVGDAVGLSTTLTFLSLVFWTWVLGPVGALLAIPMSLLFRAVLVEADPEAQWRLPLISGQPAGPSRT